MNYRPRILLSTSVLSRSLSSRAIKKKNHYDSLELDSKATQGEIKSAYFKLTMQYHPDKNSSESAKVRFRDITEAYEVLGNYQKRRQYDRGMQIKRDEMRRDDFKTQDIKKEAARARSAIYRQSSGPSGTAQMYDFDRWTKEHYEYTFRRTWVTKEDVKFWKQERERILSEQANPVTERFVLAMVFAIFAGVMGLVTAAQSFDTPVVGDARESEDRVKRGT